MGEYSHYTNFIITDPRTNKQKDLCDDFGGIVINTNESYYERECMPQQNFITDKNDTRDGEIFIRSTYGVRTIEATCFFQESLGGGDLFELKRCLGKKYQQIFQWDGADEAILAVEQGGWQSKVYYQKKFYGELTFKFVAHDPYYFILNETDVPFTNLVTGYSNVIRCAGNCDSYPLIKIIPSTTTLSFKWNKLDITLKNLTIGQTYYLDCELCQCYYMSNGIKIPAPFGTFNSDKYIQYPEIFCEGTNSFTITGGSASSLKVQLNSRII